MMNTCLSGGAEGADTLFGEMALKNNHDLIHFSFTGAKTKTSNVFIVSQEDLLVADPFLKEANKTIKRKWPIANNYVANLLRRNYYQICCTDSVYAVGMMEYGLILGGTAWTTTMYIDRCIREQELCNLNFYDQDRQKWLKYDINSRQWSENIPEKPSGLWTGIGTRKLNESGSKAIINLLSPC